ncbi:MAG: tail length tape-measure protein (endogenous virus) [Lactobacillus phage ViSo-2018b]|nr:MAG: tail length tape-measure protein [Lactobacillus phage ViSo-2018b]
MGELQLTQSQAGGGSGFTIANDNALKLVERKFRFPDRLQRNPTGRTEKKPLRSYILKSDIYKGYNEQQKLNDMRGFFASMGGRKWQN